MANFRILNMAVRVIANFSMISSIIMTTVGFISAFTPVINRYFLWINLTEILEKQEPYFDAEICLFMIIIYFIIFSIISFTLLISVFSMHRIVARLWINFMFVAITFFIFCYYKMLTHNDYSKDIHMIVAGAVTIALTSIPWMFVLYVTQVLWPKEPIEPQPPKRLFEM